MATTGEVFGSTAAAVAVTPWEDNTWNTVTNAFSDNGVTANVTSAAFDLGDQSFVLKVQGFDFSGIPDGSTINGFTVRLNTWYRAGQGSGSLDLLQLLDSTGNLVGNNQCATPVALTTTTTDVVTKGSASDMWGTSLTAADVKDPDFGIGIGMLSTAQNTDVDVDYVTIEIDYTAPTATDDLATKMVQIAQSGMTLISGG
jgi:hypothetical protein